MSALVELEQAARLHRAEERLDQCADRLGQASSPRSTTTEQADATEPEAVR